MSDAVAAAIDVPDCVPARMVNEYVYCPRLAYIEWVQGDFADNFETVDGRHAHRVVDREKGRMPDADDAKGAERIHARSVWLSALDEQLTAKADLVEGESGTVTPIDYKRGDVPDTPERSWEPERVQLCCQGLVLRANGYTCEGGVIYYVASKTRVDVPFTPELVERTRGIVAELRRVAAEGIIPPPLDDSPKCVRCSLAGICLPDETRVLAGGTPPDSLDDESVRRLLPARDDALPLYVQEQGARIGKRGETFEVRLKDTRLGKARIFETSQVCLFGNVQVTTQALGEAMSRGVPVAYFSLGGWFKGMTVGMPHKNVELRRAQYSVAGDAGKALAFARVFVATKIENCRTILMRNHAALPEGCAGDLARLRNDARSAGSVETLLGLEGLAARTYFSAFQGLLKSREGAPDDDWRFDWNGRNRRPPRDPLNAMLSYAYSLLAKDVAVTLLAVGFDPLMGFYHRPRYGRPALALDIMEEFRPIIADSVVISAVNNGVVSPSDFIRRGPAAAFKPAGRKRFLQAYERRLDALVTHPVFGYRISYRRVLDVQARLVARVLSGELPEYPGFRTR